MIMDPLIWFANREVSIIPKHFIRCPTYITPESKEWIKNKSKGRYAFTEIVDELQTSEDDIFTAILLNDQAVYFEDHADAMMYELLWARAVK
jgi:hypothetical protein